MCHYHHLTLVEREKNMFFHAQDNSVSAIAKKLGRNKATISRELRRNTKNGFYQPATAQHQESNFTFPHHIILGNEDQTRIQMDCFANTFPKDKTSPTYRMHTSMRCLIN